MEKIATTKYPINELIASRWSPRAFDISKQVLREDILSICTAANWAPSCFNDQPYRFIVWDKFHNETDYHRAFNCLGEWNQNWVKTAPVLIVAIADSKFRKNGKLNRWGGFDTGTATMAMYIQAISLGINTHPMGGFDSDKLINEFNIEEGFMPMAMIALGYASDDINVIDESYHIDEKAPRYRRALNEQFFDSNWNQPID